MPVLRLVERSNKETVETLEWMLHQAKKGVLRDFVSTFLDENGVQQKALTGLYRRDSAKALKAIMRVSVALMNAHDSVYGPP